VSKSACCSASRQASRNDPTAASNDPESACAPPNATSAPPELEFGAKLPGERHGFLADRLCLFGAGGEHQGFGEAGQHPGALLRRWVWGDEANRLTQGLEPGLQVPSGHQVDAAAFVQQSSPKRVNRGIDLTQRQVDEGQGTVYITTGVGGARGPLEHLHAIHAGTRLGIGDPVPQVQRSPVVVECLSEGVAAVRLCSRPHRPLQRLWQVARPVPVHGDLGRGPRPIQLTRTEQVGDGVGEGSVQPRPFAGQQIGDDDFAEQGVTDVVAALAGSGHQ
jgi:hypothetical protein